MPPILCSNLGVCVWIGCIGISLMCSVRGALALLRPGWRVPWLAPCDRTIALVLAIALVAASWSAWPESWLDPTTRFLFQGVLLFVGLSCHGLVGWAVVRAPRLAPLGLIAGGALLGGWVAWQLSHDSRGLERRRDAFNAAVNSVSFTPVPDAERLVARTDAGWPIGLLRPWAKAGLEEVRGRLAANQGPFPYANQVTITGPLDLTYNCCGWVFAGGRFIVETTDVERIIKDNAYSQVDRPAAGDLILYRDDQGQPVHVGIVKATGADGFVLVESKWGWTGQRVLHPPELQPYADRCAYYRSPRGGHLLRGLE